MTSFFHFQLDLGLEKKKKKKKKNIDIDKLLPPTTDAPVSDVSQNDSLCEALAYSLVVALQFQKACGVAILKGLWGWVIST